MAEIGSRGFEKNIRIHTRWNHDRGGNYRSFGRDCDSQLSANKM